MRVSGLRNASASDLARVQQHYHWSIRWIWAWTGRPATWECGQADADMRAVQLQTDFCCKEQVLTSSCYFYLGPVFMFIHTLPNENLVGPVCPLVERCTLGGFQYYEYNIFYVSMCRIISVSLYYYLFIKWLRARKLSVSFLAANILLYVQGVLCVYWCLRPPTPTISKSSK